MLLDRLTLADGLLRPDLAPATLLRTLPDAAGWYTFPYLQTERDLPVAAQFDPGDPDIRVQLGGQTALLTADLPRHVFTGLPPGEHRLTASDGHGTVTIDRLGVGEILAALGDSITEGYHGRGFHRPPDDLHAGLFPPDAVSRDGRNFPQFAPTTAVHKPEVNCFESGMTGLNDRLAAAWGVPVFVANEGWGGYSTANYLDLMLHDGGWQERMQRLAPTWYLIHLGVNDERALRPADDVERDLATIVELLMAGHGARPERILLARPCFDVWPGAEAILREYIDRIDALIGRYGLRPGPDFFAAYGADPSRWYGDDPVHPNEDGMAFMAELWADALLTG